MTDNQRRMIQWADLLPDGMDKDLPWQVLSDILEERGFTDLARWVRKNFSEEYRSAGMWSSTSSSGFPMHLVSYTSSSPIVINMTTKASI